MIDRASTCLESGGRQLLRVPNTCARARRRLHSSLWCHGLNDLNLPSWWALPVDQTRSDATLDNPRNGRRHAKGPNNQDGEFLEFLYPTRTLTFLKRMTRYGWDTMESRRTMQLGTSGIRKFSSTARKQEEEAVAVREQGLSQELGEWLENHSSAQEALYRLLELREPGKEELAWRLYQVVPETDRTPSLRVELLEFLNRSEGNVVDPNRLLQLFNAVPLADRRASSYRAAISAYLALGIVGPAVKIHETAAKSDVGLGFGTNILLAHVIQGNQWGLTMRVYDSFLEFWGDDGVEEDIPGLWDLVSTLPDLPGHAASLLEYTRQYEREFNDEDNKRRLLSLFMDGFVPTLIQSTFSAAEPNDRFIEEFFKGLRAQKLSKPLYYEQAIQKMLSLPLYQEYLNRPKPFLHLYSQLKEEAIERGDPAFRPSKKIIHDLMDQLGRHGSLKARFEKMTSIPELILDWRRWHGSLPDHTLYFLMTLYSKVGDAVKVHGFFDELRAQTGRITIRQLNQLLYVYARRLDVVGTLAQFERISNEFGLTPSTASWNILIYAYVKAEDLDGALNCFRKLLRSRVKPDAYTFEPLLGLSASRGDVESVEWILASATSIGVPIHKQTLARSSVVLALINADDVQAAEVAAQKILVEHRAGALDGPLTPTWNMLLTHYALQKDVESSRRIYREMVDNGIPLDTWTYAALMRSMVELKQTNSAYKILTTTMPNNNIQVHAFHYALVISGFVQEGQFDRAMSALRHMVKRKVKPSMASRVAALQAIGLTELQKLKTSKTKDPLTRLVKVEESIREMLAENDASDLSITGPRRRRFFDPQVSNTPDGYFGFLILLYGIRGAYNVCKELFEVVTARGREESTGYEAPLGLLTEIMRTHLRAKEYKDVEKCWKLAQQQADKLTKTWKKSRSPPGTTGVYVGSVFDPSTHSDVTAKTIALNRRMILTQPARLYIRSLLRQGDPVAATKKAQRVISNLLENGYLIDNYVWNEFIQMLVQGGRLIDAFTACEAYLMPNFFGWLRMNYSYHRRTLPRYDYMDVRPQNVAANLLMPHYATLVHMAAAWTKVKRREAVGVQYQSVAGERWASEVLAKIAPKTVEAIETMPMVPKDRLQKKYLGGF